MAGDDYQWLKDQCQFRMQVRERGFAAREIIGAGDRFYDIILGWREPDGSIVFNDIGGQKERGWNPDEGHGGLFRLRPDDTVEDMVPHGNMGTYMPVTAALAPPHFGRWGGHAFLVGQKYPGRSGAKREHLVFKNAPGEDHVEVFAVVPKTGKTGGGIPGAMVSGGFGLPGTPYEGKHFVQSLMNNTIYTVSSDGECEPFLTLEPPLLPYPAMPLYVAQVPDYWGLLAGQLIVQAIPNSSYEVAARAYLDFKYFLVRPDGSLDPEPLRDVKFPILNAVKAPPEFGPFAGHVFWTDEGPVNLMHVTMSDSGPLPYGARVFRTDLRGETHLFADHLQGGNVSLVFDRDRLLVATLRKSYSTGDYHEPDSSIYEIKYTGNE